MLAQLYFSIQIVGHCTSNDQLLEGRYDTCIKAVFLWHFSWPQPWNGLASHILLIVWFVEKCWKTENNILVIFSLLKTFHTKEHVRGSYSYNYFYLQEICIYSNPYLIVKKIRNNYSFTYWMGWRCSRQGRMSCTNPSIHHQ